MILFRNKSNQIQAAFLIGGIADYAGVAANLWGYFAGESTTAPPAPLVVHFIFWEDFLLFMGIPLLILLQLLEVC